MARPIPKELQVRFNMLLFLKNVVISTKSDQKFILLQSYQIPKMAQYILKETFAFFKMTFAWLKADIKCYDFYCYFYTRTKRIFRITIFATFEPTRLINTKYFFLMILFQQHPGITKVSRANMTFCCCDIAQRYFSFSFSLKALNLV